MSLVSTPKRPRFSGQAAQGDLPLSTQVLVMGKDSIVSFAGTSQFTARGVSACGLAAFNFARIGFQIEQNKKNLVDILNELSTREVIEEVVAICAGWSSDLHLEVDEVHKLPIFSRSLKLVSTEYGRPRPRLFQKLLGTMQKTEKSAVLIITRPPEIISCFKFTNSSGGSHPSTRNNPLFVIFDSHPRPSHPHGAGLSFSTSMESTARTLSDILPTMDESIFDSTDWQAQLLANCSAHLYVARHQRNDYEEAVVHCSLSILELRAKISELKRENTQLINSDNKQLQSEVDRLRTCIRQEQVANREVPSAPTGFVNRVSERLSGLMNHAVAGPSRTSSAHNRSVGTSSVVPLKRVGSAYSPTTSNTAGAPSIFANNPPPVPSKAPPTYEDLGIHAMSSKESDDLWLQTALMARKLQDEFDSEDRRLHQERAELARYAQSTFQCSICIEDLPEDDAARVDGCAHTMCRSCLRSFVSSKIQEHRYPIFCPLCIAIKDRKAHPSVLSRPLIEQLGISEAQSRVLTEMELAEFTIQIHCRKCRRPAFVDREDYSDAVNIVCPQSNCHHIWCKKCEQTIVADGPKHSCDGSSELDHLMKEKGWKHCPNCKTPIQKETGCNHMMCISPGCNTHFCYVCGGMIVRSALNDEINQAVSAHFRKCQLFEVPE